MWMDDEVRNRLEVVWRRLDAGLCSSRRSKRGGGIRDREVASIVERWKYRTRKGPDGSWKRSNRFLPEKLQKMTPLYVNMVEVASQQLGDVGIRDVQALLDRCRGIQEGCVGTILDWDARWNNPLTWASKGWAFGYVDDAGAVTCRCRWCRKTVCMDLRLDAEQTQSSRKSYWLNGATRMHDRSCPWRENQFDLDSEYYLRVSNMIRDLERIHRALTSAPAAECAPVEYSYPTKQQLAKLERFFSCDDRAHALAILLRGYEFLEKDPSIVQCTSCFTKTFVKNFSDNSKLNYHASWCRYRQESQLPSMILESLRDEVVGVKDAISITERLKDLETYLEGI